MDRPNPPSPSWPGNPPGRVPPQPPRPSAPEPAPGGPKTGLIAFVSAFLGTALAIGAAFAFGLFGDQSEPIAAVTTTTTTAAQAVEFDIPQIDVAVADTEIAAIAAQALPSIVRVEVINSATLVGTGSGVVFRQDGYIITNNHVVDDADNVRVVFFDGRSYQASVVGTDPLTDLAVLQIEVSGLPSVAFATADSVTIGDLAVAVGSPLGLQGGPTVTSGIVSALGRDLQVSSSTRLFGLLQTDAPINRGSSGGALLDGSGDLIGITTALAASDVGAEGLGFAVPVGVVAEIVDDLIADGDVAHAYLGIRGEDAMESIADGAIVPVGALITSLANDSAIGSAGASTGDVITGVDGAPIRTMTELVALMRTYRAGETISVTIDRDGDELQIEMVLDRRPEES